LDAKGEPMKATITDCIELHRLPKPCASTRFMVALAGHITGGISQPYEFHLEQVSRPYSTLQEAAERARQEGLKDRYILQEEETEEGEWFTLIKVPRYWPHQGTPIIMATWKKEGDL